MIITDSIYDSINKSELIRTLGISRYSINKVLKGGKLRDKNKEKIIKNKIKYITRKTWKKSKYIRKNKIKKFNKSIKIIKSKKRKKVKKIIYKIQEKIKKILIPELNINKNIKYIFFDKHLYIDFISDIIEIDFEKYIIESKKIIEKIKKSYGYIRLYFDIEYISDEYGNSESTIEDDKNQYINTDFSKDIIKDFNFKRNNELWEIWSKKKKKISQSAIDYTYRGAILLLY